MIAIFSHRFDVDCSEVDPKINSKDCIKHSDQDVKELFVLLRMQT